MTEDKKTNEEAQDAPIKASDLLCPFCGSQNIYTRKNVGSDIDPSGEEIQHIDVCECGAWRMDIERWDNFKDYRRILGKWHKKDEDGLFA